MKEKGPSKSEECANCSAPEGHGAALKKCSKCRLVSYCGQACQIQHWKDGGHKRFCLTPLERALPTPSNQKVDDTVRKRKSRECAICSEDLIASASFALPCGHSFHAQCLTSLRKFGVSQTCPLCRAPLPSGDISSNEGPCNEIVVSYLSLLYLIDSPQVLIALLLC